MCRFVLVSLAVIVMFALYVSNVFLGSSAYDDAFMRLGSFMSTLLPEHVADLGSEDGFDYNDMSSWAAHPQKLDWSDLVPPLTDGGDDGVGSKNVGVFYVYPSGYFGFHWNSPASASMFTDPLAAFGDLIADSTGMVHASVFNFGHVYTPRYRQMTGWGFMHANITMREIAMRHAGVDIQRAFQHFLVENKGRPVIVAGHSQGSMLLCAMLRAMDEIKLRNVGLVAAYLIAADLSDGDCGKVVLQCENPQQIGCFVHFNAFLREGGNREKFVLDTAVARKQLSCVNPLTFDSKLSGRVDAKHNPGSRPFLRPFDVITNLISTLQVNLMSPLQHGIVGAECRDGVVWVDFSSEASTSGFFTTGLFPGLNMHGAESSLFYKATRDNAKLRLAHK